MVAGRRQREAHEEAHAEGFPHSHPVVLDPIGRPTLLHVHIPEVQANGTELQRRTLAAMGNTMDCHPGCSCCSAEHQGGGCHADCGCCIIRHPDVYLKGA
ncbi:MAG: hypothetical protein F4X54_07345 [Chloroflexi bacterium]|nr:hypothetical protein [Chloroflexota bacterium]MYB84532.1 hypothetical protein [Chloroflexota bacterium]